MDIHRCPNITSEDITVAITRRLKDQFSKYTESEFLDLLADIVEANGSEEYQDQLLEHFIQVTGHPLGFDLIYYSENPADATPERILDTVTEWRARNGVVGFKEQTAWLPTLPLVGPCQHSRCYPVKRLDTI